MEKQDKAKKNQPIKTKTNNKLSFHNHNKKQN